MNVPSQACTACPVGAYNNISGASSAAACLPCAIGTFSRTSGVSACRSCLAGTFCPVVGLSSSFSCAYGFYCPTTGLSAPLPCQNGTYSSVTNATSCLPCLPGFMCPGSANLTTSGLIFSIDTAVQLQAALTLYNNTAWVPVSDTTLPVIGGAMYYPVTANKYFVTPNLYSPTLCPTASFSLLMWVFIQSTVTTGVLLSETGQDGPNPTAGGYHYSQLEMGSNNVISAGMWSLNNGLSIRTGPRLSSGAWHHIGHTYDSNSKILSLFVDGQFTNASTGVLRTPPWDYADIRSKWFYCIGCSDGTNLGNGGAATFGFGAMHIYNMVLSADSVRDNYYASAFSPVTELSSPCSAGRFSVGNAMVMNRCYVFVEFTLDDPPCQSAYT
jgi:hypothetical protein